MRPVAPLSGDNCVVDPPDPCWALEAASSDPDSPVTKYTSPPGTKIASLAPDVVEPVPEPGTPKSTVPIGAGLLLVPDVIEPVPELGPPKSTGPVDCEPLAPDAEPGAGLPPLRTIPAEEETPGSNTAVVDPNPLKESVPSPASIARDSSDSNAVRVDRCVFLRRADRMAASRVDLSAK